MKNMYKSIALLLIVAAWNGNAQENKSTLFSIPLSQPDKPGKLIVEMVSGSINVEAYTGREVVVKSSGNKGGEGEEIDTGSRQGMRKINNSSMEVSAEEKNNEVRVINHHFSGAITLDIQVPVNFSLKLSTVNDGNIYVKGVNGEMEISNVNGEITLESVSGSASTDTVNGDIKVGFNSITSGANMAFSSLNGNLDITFPGTLKANVKVKSDMGEIFTDFDMAMDKPEKVVKTDHSSNTYKVDLDQWVRGKINGGGPEMLFKSFNGDIMIRSK